ncbi:MAG: Rossmann-like domain-containing protein [Bacteroidota bacterium]
MEEPLKHFYSIRGFERAHIKECVIGDKYVAILHSSGNIGVCATLGTKMDDKLLIDGEVDLDKPAHRIILNAYYNAILNYERDYDDICDIFDRIDFSKYSRIVMIGYFESLYDKFSENNINLEVFDINKASNILTDISKMKESLKGAETIILTGTTIFNKTFNDIVSMTPPGCKIFLLGPSNILSDEMFRYPNIKVVFGSVFKPNDDRVLEKIESGYGTRGFLPYLNKVYIISNDYKDEIE